MRTHSARHLKSASLIVTTFTLFALGSAAQDVPQADNTPPAPVPNAPGLVRLFDGTPESLEKNWTQGGKTPQWTIENGAMTATKSNLTTKEKYTDYQLHVEFRVPYMPDKKGQARGNSGVFMQDRYEIQVLDSYGIHEPGSGDCGAVYHQYAPLVNACKPPLQWQTYDIAFRAPRFDPSTHMMKEPARVTVFQNGLLVQNAQVINGPTHITKPKKPIPTDTTKPTDGKTTDETKPAELPPAEDYSTPGPIRLQFHGNTVAYRNIWIIPLPTEAVTRYEPR